MDARHPVSAASHPQQRLRPPARAERNQKATDCNLQPDSASLTARLGPLVSLTSTPLTILVDFDGTVSLSDTVDDLLARFASAEWREVERQWQDGLIGSARCMKLQTRLITASREELDAFIDGVELDRGLVSLVRLCDSRGARLQIASDGYDYVIERCLERMGVSCAVAANRLVAVGPRRWDLESPAARRACVSRAGTCKCAVTNNGGYVLIGDGRSDFCAARRADFVFSKGGLTGYCIERRIPHQSFQRLDDIVPHLGTFLTCAAQTACAGASL